MAYTSTGLVTFVKKLYDIRSSTCYLYGGLGHSMTDSLINSKCKQYDYNMKRKEILVNAKKNYRCRYGFDCVGIIKAYLFNWNNGEFKYNKTYDQSANGMYKNAKLKGNISTMPNKPGVILHMDGHVGVYIGKENGIGYVIECTPNTKYATQPHKAGGVCKTKITARKWEHWFLHPGVNYDAVTSEPKPSAPVTYKVGQKVVFSSDFMVASNETTAKKKTGKTRYEKGTYMIKKISSNKSLLLFNDKHKSGGWYYPY